jgi:hypothetical protein
MEATTMDAGQRSEYRRSKEEEDAGAGERVITEAEDTGEAGNGA